jgi:hypothetical protein
MRTGKHLWQRYGFERVRRATRVDPLVAIRL